MSTFDIIQGIVNLVSIPIAIITIVIFIRQTKQLDDSTKSQVYQGLIDNSLKLDELLIKYPEYRKYVYGSEEITEETSDIDKLMGILDFVVDVVDNIVAHEEFIPKTELRGWQAFSQDLLNQSAVKYYLEQKGYWYEGTIGKKI